jgi:hypothetical protein
MGYFDILKDFEVENVEQKGSLGILDHHKEKIASLRKANESNKSLSELQAKSFDELSA